MYRRFITNSQIFFYYFCLGIGEYRCSNIGFTNQIHHGSINSVCDFQRNRKQSNVYSFSRFMRLHINDRFSQTILNHIRERIIFLFKQQPDSAPLIRQFQNQFSDSLGKTIEKYCGTT